MIRARLLLPTTVIIALVATALLAVSAGSVFAAPSGGVDAAPAAQATPEVDVVIAPNISTSQPPEGDVSVTEGSSGTYTVVLSSDPSFQVFVNLINASPFDLLSPNPTMLTFDTTNWDTPQTVTVTPIDDPQAEGVEYGAIRHIVTADAGGFHNTQVGVMRVIITDNDSYGLIYGDVTKVDAADNVVNLSGAGSATVVISETVKILVAGTPTTATARKAIKLGSAPTSLVIVTFSESETTFGIGTSSDTATQTMTFNSTTWDTDQYLLVYPIQDGDNQDETGEITIAVVSMDPNFRGITVGPIDVTITDDDDFGYLINPPGAIVAEGDTGTFTLRLLTAPTADVTVALSDNSTKFSVAPSSLTFDKDTADTNAWDTPRTVTITPIDDADADDETGTITLTGSGTGTDYSGYVETVLVTVNDDETHGMEIIAVSDIYTPVTTLVFEEGETLTNVFCAILTSQPSGAVTLALTSDSGRLTFDPATVTKRGNTSTGCGLLSGTNSAVSVTLPADNFAYGQVSDQIRLSVVSAAGDDVYANVPDKLLGVLLQDNDTRMVVVPSADINIDEGASAATYTLALNGPPLGGSGTVTITSDSAAYTVSPTSWSVNNNNWQGGRTVTVNVVDDADAVDAMGRITHSITGFTDAVRIVNVDDDETVGIRSPLFGGGTRINVTEGGSSQYHIRLRSEPTETVTVNISTASGLLTFQPAAPTFNSSNWNTLRLITARKSQDSIDRDNIIEDIVHTASGGEYDGSIFRGRIRIEDDDSAGFVVSSSPITATEGGSDGSYTFKLGTEPLGNVVVTARSSRPLDATVDVTTLFFTSNNWSNNQTVRVTAVDDDIDDDGETVTITHSVASSLDSKYDGRTAPSVTVNIADNNTSDIVVFPSTVNTTEGNITTLNVKLLSQPTGTVTVTVPNPPAGDVTASGSLTFGPGTWNINKPFSVTAINDDIDEGIGESLTLTFSASGGGYNSVTKDVPFNITDNDERGVTISETQLTINEGAMRTYTIVLDSQPEETTDVVVTIHDPSDNSSVTANPASVSFNQGNWSAAQTVTVRVAQDRVDETAETATVTHTVTGSDYGSNIVTIDDLPVQVTDDDERGTSVSDTSLTIAEGGNGTFTISLESEPSGPLVITFTSSAQLTVPAPANVELAVPADWQTPITVTVNTANNDFDHLDDQTATITPAFGSGTNDYSANSVAIDPVLITVTDNDMRGVTVSKNAVTLLESGTTTYTIVLHSAPTLPLTIELSNHFPEDLTVNPASLEFDSSNWSTVRTVTLTAIDDDYDEGVSDLDYVGHSFVGGGDHSRGNVTIAAIPVTITDDDTRGYNLDTTSLVMNESEAELISISLQSAPTAPLTITITSPAPDVVLLIAPGNPLGQSVDLIFDDTNWNMVQRFRVVAFDDEIDRQLEMETIPISLSVSGGGDYNRTGPGNISVTVIDNDTRDVVISLTAIQVTEDDTGVDFTVRLDSQPTADVTITFSHDLTVGTHATGVTISPPSITFTSGELGNWPDDQTITVSAAIDADSVGESGEISLAITGGDYAAFDAAEITLTLLDMDEGGVIVAPQSLMITEGGSDTFTVRLNTDPLTTTTVTMSITEWSGDNADNGTLTISVLTFMGGASGNWDSPQEVIVGSNVDADAVDEVFTVMLTVSTNYVVANPPPSVAVEVTDPHMQGVTLSEVSLSVTEGGATATYTAVLDTQPVGTNNVLLFIESSRLEDVMSQPTQLDFTKGNWNTAQTVTVTAVDDDYDEVAVEMHTLEHHTISGGDYGPGTPIADIDVLVNDDDVRGVIVSASLVQFIEEAQQTYTIVLESAPLGGTVTITPLSDKTGKITASPTSLTFNDVNWNAAQTVTLSSPHDADTDDETATISHGVAGADYGTNNVTANSVDVEVEDNDMEGVLVTPLELRFKEGGTATYEVVLETQPSVGQKVTITITDDSAQVRATPDTLEFTRDTWDIAQTVTVQSLTDADELNDIVNIMHAVDNYGPVMVADQVEATVAEFDIAELLALADLEAPLELTATAGGGFITLRWKAPLANADGRKPTGYQYRYTPLAIENFDSPLGSGSAWLTRAGGSTARFVQISGLINLAGYIFQVRSVDGILLAEANAADDLSTMIDTTGIYEHRTKDC